MEDTIFTLISSGKHEPRTDKMYLSGTVRINDTASKALVSVYRRIDNVLVASAISDATTGIWRIWYTEAYGDDALTITASDFTNPTSINAQVFDYISQIAPPE